MKENTDNNVVLGFWVYIMSDCVLFAGLFAAYAVLSPAVYGGPTPKELFSLPFVLTETILLLTSSFTVGLAMLAAHHRKEVWAIVLLVVTLALGLSFVGMEISEFTSLVSEGQGPNQSAFLSSFFTLVGTHGLHVALGSLWMLVLIAHVIIFRLTKSVVRKLMCLNLFWHFLDIVWIFIFTFVYLFAFV